MARRGWLPRIGRNESYFSVIHARDLAAGIVAAGVAEAATGRTYFLANPEYTCWTDFGMLAAGLMGRRARVLPVPFRVARWLGRAGELQSRYSGKPGIISREKVAEARCRFWICDVSAARARPRI